MTARVGDERIMSDLVKELCDIAVKAVELARKHGADDAEVLVRDGSELTAKVRLGEPELVQEAGSRGPGSARVQGRHAARSRTRSDLRSGPLEAFVAETVTLAELSEPDELDRLPDPADLARSVPELDLWDESVPRLDAAWALQPLPARGEGRAATSTHASPTPRARASSRVLGASAFATLGRVRRRLSRQLRLALRRAAVRRRRQQEAQRLLVERGSRSSTRLDDPEAVGREAARRTVATLGSRKVETCEVPIVFDPEVGRALVGTVFSVSNGSSFCAASRPTCSVARAQPWPHRW